jgi:hypothetical protein
MQLGRNDVNKNMGRCLVKKSTFILSAGVLTVLLGPFAGAVSLSEAGYPQPPSLNNSRINRSLPGARTGVLKMMTDTTAQIDNVSYPLARGIVIETQTGSALPLSTEWQKILRHPLRVQYWLGQTGINQMIVYLPS